MKSQATSLILILMVIVVVGGVAWFRSMTEKSEQPSSYPPPVAAVETPAPAAVLQAQPFDNASAEMTSPPVQEGDFPTTTPPTGKIHDDSTSATNDMQPANAGNGPASTNKLPRVVDLGADKCIPCKKMAPILVELRQEYEGRVIVDFIDVWKDPKAGEPYKISVIPTQIFFDADGNEIWRHVGFLPKEDFVAKFKELGVN